MFCIHNTFILVQMTRLSASTTRMLATAGSTSASIKGSRATYSERVTCPTLSFPFARICPSRRRCSTHRYLNIRFLCHLVAVARQLECRTVNREDRSSSAPNALSKPGQFLSSHFACVVWMIQQKPFVPCTWCICQGT